MWDEFVPELIAGGGETGHWPGRLESAGPFCRKHGSSADRASARVADPDDADG